MKIKCAYTDLVPIEKLTPHPRNDNKHDVKHAQLLAKVFKANDIRHPIIVSKRSGFIVAGHLRLDAAKICEMESFPVDFQEFDSEADEYRFLSSDNNVARYAELDQAKMLFNMDELNIDTFDFDFEEMGLIDFTLPDMGESIEDDEDKEEGKKYILEVQVHNDMDLDELYDDLVSKGYMVKKK